MECSLAEWSAWGGGSRDQRRRPDFPLPLDSWLVLTCRFSSVGKLDQPDSSCEIRDSGGAGVDSTVSGVCAYCSCGDCATSSTQSTRRCPRRFFPLRRRNSRQAATRANMRRMPAAVPAAMANARPLPGPWPWMPLGSFGTNSLGAAGGFTTTGSTILLGAAEGAPLGSAVGSAVGAPVGSGAGAPVGSGAGGATVGSTLGGPDGRTLGTREGDAVGARHPGSTALRIIPSTASW
mmetsp:Transcript_11445/g.22718  ORF Transcript_11445/g.22718 Transcript_11445/m.22718 type:complete len:235 (+) Transcript_11445:1227-1931(+)